MSDSLSPRAREAQPMNYEELKDRIKDLESELAAVTEQCVRAERDLNAAYNREAAREGWEPIATAPKDGTHIAVITMTGWREGHPYPLSATVHWFDGWQLSVNQRGEYSEYVWGPPTHWMPLPSPPPAYNREAAREGWQPTFDEKAEWFRAGRRSAFTAMLNHISESSPDLVRVCPCENPHCAEAVHRNGRVKPAPPPEDAR